MNTSKLKTILNKEGVAGYIFILPFIIGFLVFSLMPIVTSFFLSFTKYDILSAPTFIGLDNFKTMFFNDAKFWRSFGITFFYVVTSVPLRLIFALIVAMLLVRNTKATPLYRAVYYLPSIMGGSVAVAILWRRLFATADGIINSMLARVGLDPVPWLTSPDVAIWTLVILAAWQFGSSMLIFLSGLKQIPDIYYEAAVIDGATKFQSFYKITLPMLTPVILFNLVMQTINGFMAFTQSFIITQGKPLDSTLFYTVYLYQKAFANHEMGLGSAMAWFMLIIVGILTLFIFKSSNNWVYYEAKGE